MNHAPFTPEERKQLIEAFWASERRTSWPVFQTLTSGQRKKEYAKQDRLLDEYAERLPFVPVSRCPLCKTVLQYVFDPMGLDGIWWFKDKLAEYPPPRACAHFRVLLGAVDFHGRQPEEANVHRTVRPGPGAPFVVPRMLELPDMSAVLSSRMLPYGDEAYLIAYFSKNPVHGALLHQPWCREDFEVFDEEGEYQAWTISNDQWDFDLRAWIEKGRLMWINPGGDSLTIRRQGDCPYENQPGVRAPQIIQRGKLSLLPLPTGEPVNPFV